MRKVIVSEFLTLDGVMEGPGKDPVLDRGPEDDKFKFDELAAADALLLGRVTYKVFAVEVL